MGAPSTRLPAAGGDRSLLADSFADIVDIEWSPDGTRIMVLDRGRYRLQVMNADGSDLHALVEGEDACCGPHWSPDGHRIAYMLSVGEAEKPEPASTTRSRSGRSHPTVQMRSRCSTRGAASLAMMQTRCGRPTGHRSLGGLHPFGRWGMPTGRVRPNQRTSSCSRAGMAAGSTGLI